VVVEGPSAWVIDDRGRIRVIDISKPTAPVVIEVPSRSQGEHDAGSIFEPVHAADLINGRVDPAPNWIDALVFDH
jgi:hypothetical protein